MLGQQVGDGEGQGIEVTVMIIEKRTGQHVWAGHGELEGSSRDLRGPPAVLNQVEPTSMQGLAHDGGGLGPEAHLLLGPEGLGVGPPNDRVASSHGADEVLDHAVGVGVIDVEAVELTIRGEVDSSLSLSIEDDPGGIDYGLLGGQGAEPVGHGIGTHRGG